MNETFARQASRLFALAAQALGWAPETFWHATPHELLGALADPSPAERSSVDRATLDHLLELDRHG